MIYVAASAKEKILEISRQESLSDDYFVRVSVVSGGCSGLSYKMDFDKPVPMTRYSKTMASRSSPT
jgi:iron-sulfur cluster assembly protein